MKQSVVVLAVALSGLLPISVMAQGVSAPGPEKGTDQAVVPAVNLGVAIQQDSTRTVTIPGEVSSVISGNPAIASVQPLSQRRFEIFGSREGHTRITAISKSGDTLANIVVTVTPSGYKAGSISAGLPHQANAAALPGGGVILHGTVSSPLEAMEAETRAKLIAGAGKVDNQLAVRQPQQVVLKVKIAQMSRQITQQLGINWQSAAGGVSIGKFVFGFQTAGNLLSGTQPPGSYSLQFPSSTVPIDGVLNALAQDNLAQILAEPTLTALSGHQASFISGGSFPVPIPGANGQTGIEFKNYGVQLAFRPVVLSDGQIVMQVRPTVSQISTLNSVSVAAGNSNLVVPSLVEQSADTTVMLGSGQTLAIAGLLENQSNQTDSGVPGLRNVPVLGMVFHSDDYTRSESELVVLVTPYIARPRSNPAAFRVPGHNWTPPNLVQRFVLGRQTGGPPVAHRLPGQLGFLLK